MISCDFSQTLLFPKMRAMVCDSYIVRDWKMPFGSWIRKFSVKLCCGITSDNKTLVRFTNYSDNETSALKNLKYLASEVNLVTVVALRLRFVLSICLESFTFWIFLPLEVHILFHARL